MQPIYPGVPPASRSKPGTAASVSSVKSGHSAGSVSLSGTQSPGAQPQEGLTGLSEGGSDPSDGETETAGDAAEATSADDTDMYFDADDQQAERATPTAQSHRAGSPTHSVVSNEHSESEGAAQRTMEQLLRLSIDGVNSYLDSQNAFSVLFRECLETENKQLLLAVLAKIQAAAGGPSTEGTTEPSSSHYELPVAADELKSLGLSAFLFDAVVHPRSAVTRHELLWSSWNTLLETFAHCLKHDLARLHAWR